MLRIQKQLGEDEDEGYTLPLALSPRTKRNAADNKALDRIKWPLMFTYDEVIATLEPTQHCFRAAAFFFFFQNEPFFDRAALFHIKLSYSARPKVTSDDIATRVRAERRRLLAGRTARLNGDSCQSFPGLCVYMCPFRRRIRAA